MSTDRISKMNRILNPGQRVPIPPIPLILSNLQHVGARIALLQIVACAILVFQPRLAQAQHSHLNAGALSPEPRSQLAFINGAGFVTNSGYVLGLNYATNGQYAGYYHGSISLTALPATVNNGGPAFGHAALGSFLEARIESVTGPVGGRVGFWEELDAAPRFTVDSGTTNSPHRFLLSESDASPGSDPAGHIHGRRFTATAPGLYTVGLRLIDTSRNGDTGDSIHSDGEIFPIFFQAGVTLAGLTIKANDVAITFATISGRNYSLERTARPTASNEWQTVAGPFGGDNHLRTVTDSPQPDEPRFYRLRAEAP